MSLATPQLGQLAGRELAEKLGDAVLQALARSAEATPASLATDTGLRAVEPMAALERLLALHYATEVPGRVGDGAFRAQGLPWESGESR